MASKFITRQLFDCRTALIVVALLLFSCPLIAQRVVEVTGEGGTRGSATHKALVQALEMVNGVDIQSKGNLKEFFSAVDTGNSSAQEFRVESAEEIRTATNGYIRSYEVLSETETEVGWEIRLKAAVFVYDPSNPRPGMRPTIAVLNAILQGGGLLDIPGEGGGRHLEDLSTGLGQKLQDLGMFNLVEREYLNAILEEQGLISDGLLDQAEQAKLGQLLGADYILQVVVSELSVAPATDTTPSRGRIQAALRITGSATGQQIGIRTFQLEAAGRDLKALAGGGASGSYPGALAAAPIPEWGSWIEANLGPVRLLGFKKRSKRGKAYWGFSVDNSNSLVAINQVYDLFVQENNEVAGGAHWIDCEEVCSIRITDASARVAQAELYLLAGETLEDMRTWLEDSQALFHEREGNPAYRYILRRRVQG